MVGEPASLSNHHRAHLADDGKSASKSGQAKLKE
jgi:hypothetical protein